MKITKGFTLIEVLIALVIIAIAMTAIIKTTGNNIRTTHYISEKTLGYWAASEVMNERLAGAVALPDMSDTETGQIILLNQILWWSFQRVPTNNGRINKIIVKIFKDESRENPMLELISYAS